MRKNLFYLTLFSLTTIYLETLLHMHVMRVSLSMDYLQVIAFSFGYSAFLWTIVRFFQKRRAIRIFGALIGVLTVTFFTLDVYYQIMGDFYSLFMSGDVLLGITFLGRFFTNLQVFHLLYFLPLTLYTLYAKRIIIKRYSHVFEPALILGVAGIWFALALLLISPEPLFTSDSPFNYSERDIYEKQPSAYQVIDEFGVLTYLRLDFQSITSESLIEDDAIDNFLSLRDPHEPNDYTGLLADKNVIYILAESFDETAIHPELMPVLTQLFERGMVFENYYAPHYYRNTADTEFMVHTGFYPSRQVPLSMESYQANTFTNTLPRLLANDYRSYAYHNYTDYFYPRTDFLSETIGFDVYKDALDLGLLDEEVTIGAGHEWPSDQSLFHASVDDYIQDDQFFTYYLTVSGHMNYDDSHPIVAKNLPTVRNLLSPDDPAFADDELLAYYAAQLELEYMVSDLLNTLKAEGRAKDTVLILASDHYPYGLDDDSLETAGIDLDTIGLDIHNVPFVIYHPDLPSQRIDDVFSSVDVLPTLANLLGLSVNPEMMMGNDVFAPGSNIVRFQNASILTEDYRYNIEAINPTIATDGVTTEEAITMAFNEMIFMQDLNHALLEFDYQRYLNP